ncbi:MAG TPA: hypothetical protein PKD09_09370 [Aggregatilinea sp.]|uniref:hypothetical protein n=1 Tax=Aggregatilinea sp. TaxID=2806333 RepID=UPI002CE6BE87|nr:hypothetical protein [Aggregatilinea sp.]HML21846.1 hypothetical protein [Aggregatilinea sp.]
MATGTTNTDVNMALVEGLEPTKVNEEALGLKISTLQQRYVWMVKFKDSVLREGIDYGVIPGTDKKSLLQPGAQKMAILFGLHARFYVVEKVEDWTGADHGGEPFFHYLVKCELYDDTGAFQGEMEGEVNSWESRYRYRWYKDVDLPEDISTKGLRRRTTYLEEYDFAIQRKLIAGKWAKSPEYWEMWDAAIASGMAKSFKKKSGSGEEKDAWQMQTVAYRVPNDDVHSQINTMVKIAHKRAFVGAVILVTGASEFFTQDLEDFDEDTLESMGLKREGRSLPSLPDSKEGKDSGKDKGSTLQRTGRALPEKEAAGEESVGELVVNWRSGKGSKMIPALRKSTGLNNQDLLAVLDTLVDEVDPTMTVDEITAVIMGQSGGPEPSTPAPDDDPATTSNIPF